MARQLRVPRLQFLRGGVNPFDQHPVKEKIWKHDHSLQAQACRSLQALRQLMATQKAKTPKIDVATFKDMLGVTRKYAIPLLEYLDQQRITRRVGDERIIL